MSKAEQVKAKRSAKKNRKLRKFRSKFKKSKKGMRASIKIAMPDGTTKTKRVRKKFYFETYASDGRHLGTFWFLSPRVAKDIIQKYKDTHGVKHPAALPQKTDKSLVAIKKRHSK